MALKKNPRWQFLKPSKFHELPKCTVILQREEDDMFDNYKFFKDHMTLAGGITLNQLKYGTKQEYIDFVKKAFDALVPGGGYIFIQDRALLGQKDTNIENLKAVYQCAIDYGIY